MGRFPHELDSVPAWSYHLVRDYLIYRSAAETYHYANEQSKAGAAKLTEAQLAAIAEWEGTE